MIANKNSKYAGHYSSFCAYLKHRFGDWILSLSSDDTQLDPIARASPLSPDTCTDTG
jgi:hypothetical protein